MKKFRWFLVLSGVLLALLGVFIMLRPAVTYLSLAVFIGIAMFVSGISEIVTFCTESKGQRSGWLLAGGILSVLFGIWTMFGRGVAALAIVIPFMFAAWILATNIMRIVGAISMKSAGFRSWGWILAFAIIGTMLGFMLMFQPMASAITLIYFLAFSLISRGINDIILFFHMRKQ